MERKIGEIFPYKGEWYQCVDDTGSNDCSNCCFEDTELCGNVGHCVSDYRKGGNNVCFKKLEKVGEPHWFGKRLMQSYKLFTEAVIPLGIDCFSIWHQDLTIEIEIKQNQEDMEEKKLSLKPFDLEAAKAGKPVCTRDGCKARIILFDLKDKNYPIAAVVQDKDGDESIRTYTTEEIYDKGEISGLDLMMLPEKHEGWINICKNADDDYFVKGIFRSEKFARNNEANYPGLIVATTKIEWEE